MDIPSSSAASSPFGYSPPPQRSSRLPILLGILLGVAVLWYLPFYAQRLEFAREKGRTQAIDEAMPTIGPKLDSFSTALGLLAAKVGPSVVSINTRSAKERESLFGPTLETQEGLASGVIVDPEGYIVTNNHVVEGASDVQVTLSDNSSYTAKVLGTDPGADLAVLKIPATGLIAAQWGDSDQLAVGNLVLAIGNPIGLDRTVTLGIISAKNRHGVGKSPTQAFLQTDAAINPGNSGGPLVNMAGQIVGINTAIAYNSDASGPSYQGIGFSLPSNTAHDVYEQLKKGQSVPHAYGYLGVQMRRVTLQDAQRAGLNSLRGAVVRQIVPGSPAEAAGLKAGDVIIQWDGHPVQDPTLLSLLVAQTKIGSTVSATVVRQGEQMKIDITVAKRPDQS